MLFLKNKKNPLDIIISKTSCIGMLAVLLRGQATKSKAKPGLPQ